MELEMLGFEWGISGASSGGVTPRKNDAGADRRRPEPWGGTTASPEEKRNEGERERSRARGAREREK